MSENLAVCEVEPELKAKLLSFRFRKATNNAAIIMKVDRAKLMVRLEEELEDVDVDDLREALPTSQPRFLAYGFKLVHNDGRISYPICFVYSSPQDCKPELQMMYAGSILSLVNQVQLTKVLEIRCLEEFTEEWLRSQYIR